jgi:hypothetical protein
MSTATESFEARACARTSSSPEVRRARYNDEQSQPHGELREEVVIGDREGKVNAVQGESVHASPFDVTSLLSTSLIWHKGVWM